MDHLEQLENTSIHILREAYASFKSLGMLWSIGKDSTVMLWLVRKAFFGHVPFPLIHIDTFYKIPEMIEYRDRLTKEWKLTMIYGVNESALKQKKTFPDGNVDRITCCRLLKTEALKATISGEGRRYRYNHEKGGYEIDAIRSPLQESSPAHGRTRRGRGRRSDTSPPATSRTSGTSVPSPLSSGTSTRPISRPIPMCGFIRFWTGRNSISGNTSRRRRSRRFPSITIRGTGNATVRSGVIPAPSRLIQSRGRSTRLSKS